MQTDDDFIQRIQADFDEHCNAKDEDKFAKKLHKKIRGRAKLRKYLILSIFCSLLAPLWIVDLKLILSSIFLASSTGFQTEIIVALLFICFAFLFVFAEE